MLEERGARVDETSMGPKVRLRRNKDNDKI